LGAVVILLLTGCIDIYQEVSLNPEEHWKVQTRISLPSGTVDLLGEEGLQEMEAEWKAEQSGLSEQGITASFQRREESGDVIFEITMEGDGWDLLNQEVFEGEATIEETADGQVRFAYDLGEEVAGYVEVGGTYTLVVKAGKVHSHSDNATEAKGGTITWENPTTPMEVVVTPGAGGGLSPVVIGALVLGAVVLVLIIVFVLLRVFRKGDDSEPA
jgi:hypothetical protein